MTEKNLVESMSANVNVGMDEVVSVFVSRYETALFEKKDDLSDKIKTIKKEQEDLDNRLINSIDKSQYEMTIEPLNVKSNVHEVRVVWSKDTSPTIKIDIVLKDAAKTGGYHSSLSKAISVKVGKKDISVHDEAVKRLDDLNAELMDVMTKIKAVSRKERQIRGKISEMKLKESGFEGLLENPEMVKLVQLD